ncbi:MAG: two component transcriptional regulator, AraC family [Firmicutes bacterium]|nr:two component transcriptional regulator, AraC family [Bacillota bacterium]
MYKLLIVDDEELERQAIRLIVEKHCSEIGFISEAGDGESAVEIAKAERPNIIVMDIRIPGITGLEATKQIKTFLPECKIIILTAFEEFHYARQAIALGTAEYLLKPVRTPDLVKVFRQVVGQLKQIREKDLAEIELRQNLNKAMPFIQMSFVQELVTGCFDDLPLLRQRAAFLGMRNDPGVAIVIGIDYFNNLVRNDSEKRIQLMKNKMTIKVCESAGDDSLVMPISDERIAVVFGVAPDENWQRVKKVIRQKTENIQASLLAEVGNTVTIGVGCYYNDAREVYKSYMEAMSAYQQGFFLDTNAVVFFDDLPSSYSVFEYPFKNERAVLNEIRCGDRKAAKEKLNLLLEELLRIKTNIETVKAYALELLVVLSRAAVEGGASLEKMTLQNFSLISKLAKCRSQSQVHQLLTDSMGDLMDNMVEKCNTVNARVVSQACDYIVHNCNRNLMLEEVAKTVHLSPFYFSRVFKQEQGCNFVEFLTKTRVERAKRLLHEPNLNVVRIALECGYQDASYFCKVFRQIVGVTPNQFRCQCYNKVSPAKKN